MGSPALLANGATVCLLLEEGVPGSLGDQLLKLLSRVPGPLSFEVDLDEAPSVAQVGSPGEYDQTAEELDEWHRSWIFDRLQLYRLEHGIPERTVLVLLGSSLPLEWGRRPETGIDPGGHRSLFLPATVLEELEQFSGGAPLEVLVGYQLVEHLIRLGLEEVDVEFDPFDFAHEEARGCLNDLVVDPLHFKRVMRAGDLCDECLDYMRKSGASEELIAQLPTA